MVNLSISHPVFVFPISRKVDVRREEGVAVVAEKAEKAESETIKMKRWERGW